MEIVSPAVQTAFREDSDRAFRKLVKDRRCAFWVTWSQADETIVSACEAVIASGRLTAERGDASLRLRFGESELGVTLTGEPEDRHTTLVALNEILAGAWEIRFVWESIGGDAGAFLVLPCASWRELELQHPDVVARRTLVLTPSLNVFTELTPKMKPPSPPAKAVPAKPWWKVWA